MKILSFGLDKSILNKNSPLAKRTVEYGNLVKKYTVIVPSKEYKEIVLSEQANAIGAGVGNNKIIALFKIYNRAKDLLIKEKLVLENHRGYDIITVQDQYYLALVSLLLARKFKLGFEIQVHGFEKYYGLRKLIAKFVIPRANVIRTVSQRLKKRLVKEFGVRGDRITVVPIFVDIEQGVRHPIGCRTPSDKFIFFTVGRLVPVKNIEMQIKALAKIVGTQNFVSADQKIELWIVGEGEEKEKLKDLCCELRVTSYVKFLGWQDDLEKFYSQADVFLLTSNHEGWGMAIIEAASCGLPIIMTDVGCAGEVIKNGESGIVISVSRQEELENAMIRLIKNEELRKKFGNNAQQVVMNLPTKEETLKLYKQSWGEAFI